MVINVLTIFNCPIFWDTFVKFDIVCLNFWDIFGKINFVEYKKKTTFALILVIWKNTYLKAIWTSLSNS